MKNKLLILIINFKKYTVCTNNYNNESIAPVRPSNGSKGYNRNIRRCNILYIPLEGTYKM